MNPSIHIQEIEHLNHILKEIQAQLRARIKSYQKYQTDFDDVLSDYWENTHTDSWDEAQFVESVSRERNIRTASYQRQRQLQKLLQSPYFGRIDFAEETSKGLGVAEQIYIGVATLSEENTKHLLVYDWRSPIASLFYDHQLGPANYPCPAGRIFGNITLKRQYKINNGQLEYLFDSDLKIDDEILQEILGKSADAKMRTIVTTIQREQNQAIRDDTHPVLFVQGPAGSGKTSIALHRVAYLLYRDRSIINSKNILIFSPNRIFSDYISDVLPELGEENVLQTTFTDYLIHFLSDLAVEIEERDEQLEYLYSSALDSNCPVRIASIRYKSSPQFFTVIQNYLQEITSRIKDDTHIEFEGETIISQSEWDHLFSKELSFLPVTKRLSQLKKIIQKKLRPIIHRLRQAEEEKIAATGEEVNEKVIKALARIAVMQQTASFTTEISGKTEIHPVVLYRRLFEDESLLERLSGSDGTPENWQDIRIQTLKTLEQGGLSYEDSLALLYFRGSLEGFPVKNDIRQLVIDEAQDYTLLQYEILKQIFPKGSWTVLGDPAQSIHPYLQTASFQTAAELLKSITGGNVPEIIRLTKSYRSTSEIQTFAGEILEKNLPVEPVHRPGPLPEIISLTDPAASKDVITKIVEKLIQEGQKSIAVICKTAKEARQAFKSLKGYLEIKLVVPETSGFQQGTLVIPAYLAKGLEFDAVIVYGADADNYHSEAERNILYTVCTRALHRLVLLIHSKPSPFIEKIDSRFYKMKEGF